MRYLLILLLLFLFACDEEEVIDRNIYSLELRYDGDRLEFKQISLPDNVFDVVQGLDSQSWDVVGLSDTNDVRVALTYDCSVGGKGYSDEVQANFYEDRKTVLLIERVVTCQPNIQVIYE